MPILHGSTVSVHYKLSNSEGVLLYQSEEPLTFTIGEEDILPAFQQHILGREVGDVVEFVLTPEEAYGLYQQKWVITLSRKQLEGEGEDITPGQTLTLYTPDGQSVLVTVLKADEETITVDANHPLAGQTLHYQVEVLAVS